MSSQLCSYFSDYFVRPALKKLSGCSIKQVETGFQHLDETRLFHRVVPSSEAHFEESEFDTLTGGSRGESALVSQSMDSAFGEVKKCTNLTSMSHPAREGDERTGWTSAVDGLVPHAPEGAPTMEPTMDVSSASSRSLICTDPHIFDEVGHDFIKRGPPINSRNRSPLALAAAFNRV